MEPQTSMMNKVLEAVEPVDKVLGFTGSVAAVGSAAVWGFTQQEWLVMTSIGGFCLGLFGVGLQLWVSWHKIQRLKAETRRANRYSTAERKVLELTSEDDSDGD